MESQPSPHLSKKYKPMNTYISSRATRADVPMAITIIIIFTVLSFHQVTAQDQSDITLTGTVVFSEDDQPAPGVNVYVKGSAGKGTYTDAEGVFSVGGLHTGDVLVFSFVGRETIEWNVKNVVNPLRIVMYPDPIQMVEEPLVIGEQSKASFIARVFRNTKK